SDHRTVDPIKVEFFSRTRKQLITLKIRLRRTKRSRHPSRIKTRHPEHRTTQIFRDYIHVTRRLIHRQPVRCCSSRIKRTNKLITQRDSQRLRANNEKNNSKKRDSHSKRNT